MLVVDYVKILSGDRNYKVKKDLINANFSMQKLGNVSGLEVGLLKIVKNI